MSVATTQPTVSVRSFVAVLAASGTVLLWAYWSTLAVVAERWSTDPQYSHGYLVPAFSVALLWLRRKHLEAETLQPSWLGLAIILLAGLCHYYGAYYYVDTLEAVGFVLALLGLFVCTGGKTAFRWCWPAVGFLIFMLPLPHRVETALSHPLQRLATIGSTYLLQTLGFPAIAEGNIIVVDELVIGVVEACNGLGMLVTFFALSTAMTLIIPHSLLVRSVIILSAIPIALASNILRIMATVILSMIFDVELVTSFFHDFAGLFMVPIALGLVAIELWIIGKLFVDDVAQTASFTTTIRQRPMPVGAHS